ncbi:hypothetical protein BHE74_00009385 [Ensete ventricosum]|nr:hypothetical protein BHE74_00009385 [Ensete ventricosum]
MAVRTAGGIQWKGRSVLGSCVVVLGPGSGYRTTNGSPAKPAIIHGVGLSVCSHRPWDFSLWLWRCRFRFPAGKTRMYRAELFNVLLGRVDWKWKESFVCTLPVTSSHLSDNELIAEYVTLNSSYAVLYKFSCSYSNSNFDLCS